ncbi:hypothetical protein [Enterobacter cloacae]|uniref:hypothetical protein n=1 Tax=Enterobacter cloacae TaxID=550 RepID=UPI0014331F77|nr:hypothetical protein [Enterobacter cloacae]UJC65307.1 hypothetical protein J4G41_15425 [Enterobacter cloacae]HAV2238030.1 hypothetical protein [Enterobacter cloacae]HDC4264215.1 hypothetical protein [Enterobacter cloacae]
MARQKTIKIKLPILNEALQTCIDRSARFNVIAAGEKAGDTAKPSNGTRANSGTVSVEYKIGTAIEAQGKVYTAATMGGKYSTQLSVKNTTSGKEKDITARIRQRQHSHVMKLLVSPMVNLSIFRKTSSLAFV